MSLVGFEPGIPAMKGPQSYASDCTPTNAHVYNFFTLKDFQKCDFSKEQCSSLKMIVGSKHVGSILSVLM